MKHVIIGTAGHVDHGKSSLILALTGRDTDIDLRATAHPEFDAWRWHDYWIPLEAVIEFKREVYRLALDELAPLVNYRPRHRSARHEASSPGRLAGEGKTRA